MASETMIKDTFLNKSFSLQGYSSLSKAYSARGKLGQYMLFFWEITRLKENSDSSFIFS